MAKRSFSELQLSVHETARLKGWWDTPTTPDTVPSKLMLIVSELSEALEEYRANPNDLQAIHYDMKNKPTGFATELADTVIRAMDIAEYFGIDLEHVIQVKAEYNQTREYRHGGKAV